jgi:hypothetical protein
VRTRLALVSTHRAGHFCEIIVMGNEPSKNWGHRRGPFSGKDLDLDLDLDFRFCFFDFIAA